MKKLLLFVTVAVLLLGACTKTDSASDRDTEDLSGQEQQVENKASSLGKTLVVWYSYTGNIKKDVESLCELIEADAVEVIPTEKGLKYEANNYAIGSAQIQAIKDNPNSADSYPGIDTSLSGLENYETIIVATPLWWSRMAAPMQTLLFRYGGQMAGKNIGIIVSSASSGIDQVLGDAKRLIPLGKFMELALWIKSSETSGSKAKAESWLKSLK